MKAIWHSLLIMRPFKRGRRAIIDSRSSLKPSRGRFSASSGWAAAILGLVLILAGAPAALAMRVAGTLVNGHGEPLASRDLHFQNCVTYDIYLAPTHTDGSFAQRLPPGCYQLRDEIGAVLIHAIYVSKYDVNLGQVKEGARAWFKDLFERQTIFPTLLTSPAPSTAYVFTRDLAAGLLPPSAEKVPVPSSESEWLKLQEQTSSINTQITAPAPQTPLNSPGAITNIPPPTVGAGPDQTNPEFNEPQFNPGQPVTSPPPGAVRASPYQ